MKQILFVNACVRPQSRTHRLATHVLSKMDGEVEEINLEIADIAPLNRASLQKRDAFVEANDFTDAMFQFAKQFVEADEIVVAAPYWDLSFPATVRTYFEAVTVCGLSFCYTPEGQPKGMCKAKRITYVTTAGGTIGAYHLGYDFVKALAEAFFEIPETLCYTAENLDVIGNDAEAILQEALDAV